MLLLALPFMVTPFPVFGTPIVPDASVPILFEVATLFCALVSTGSLLFMVIPSPVLPEITLRVTVVVFGLPTAPMTIPPTSFGTPALPAGFVPILFDLIVLPLEVLPATSTPVVDLPLMVLLLTRLPVAPF